MKAAADGPLVLALETSCDETGACLYQQNHGALGQTLFSQIDLHRPHGGVVPEAASRNHLLKLPTVVAEVFEKAQRSLADVDLFAATAGPGLSGALLIGDAAAKAYAIAAGKPFLPVNHMEGHLFSPFFGKAHPPFPFVALVVSGGHTLLVEVRALGQYRLLATTRDDAAGEAFDKVAKMLALPYPGGPEIEKAARGGDPKRFALPRSLPGRLEFSFSGLKTAVRYMLPDLRPADLADLCASFQEAVVDSLVQKSRHALRETGRQLMAVSGGVACNQNLRTRLREALPETELYFAEPSLCTDNAAMIAYVAALRFASGQQGSWTDEVDPNLPLAFCDQ